MKPACDFGRAHEIAARFLSRWRDLPTRSARDDLAQEASLELWKSYRRLREARNMPAYVRTIARRVRRRAIIAQLGTRSVSIDHPRVFEELVDAPSHGFLRVAGDWVPKPRLLGELDCVLASIEPLNRAILCAYYEGFSCAELSDRYALPVEAIKGRLYRIRHHIRAELTGLRSTRPEVH